MHRFWTMVLAAGLMISLISASGCSDDDKGNPCQGISNSCVEQGKKQCSADLSAVVSCQQDAAGCWVWSQTKACETGKLCDKVSADCPCTPSCTGKACGSDGCGGSCAPGCAGGKTCDAATGKCEAADPSSCPLAQVTSCSQLGDSAAQAKGCCQPDGVAVFCQGSKLEATDCKLFQTTCGAVSAFGMNYCAPTGKPYCQDVVAPKTTGKTLSYSGIDHNWSMACWNDDNPQNRLIFVFVEDTDKDDTAIRFPIYVDHANAPKVGVTYDLAQFSVPSQPLYVSLLSGVKFDEGGTYDKEYLVYAGKMVITQFDTTHPVGTQLKVEFTDIYGRETKLGASSCTDVVNGDRMHIASLKLDLEIGALHTDQNCIDWGGG